MQSNKGRFKCPHEAQAVWNCALGFHKSVGGIDLEQDWLCENEMKGIINDVAEVLYKAGLIHGSIYDEDGRIEDKDVAHELWFEFNRNCHEKGWRYYMYFLDSMIVDSMIKEGEIKGTIFY